MFGQLSILHIEGSITVHDSTIPDDWTVLEGGWLYAAGMIVETSGTAPAFSFEVASMLHTVPVGMGAARAGFSLGDLGSLIGNFLSMLIHYWQDARIPYTPPEDCTGPTVTASCEVGDLPCRYDIDDVCVAGIDAIPGVSTAFKKCMKGRCGCGGSTFPPIRITCADSSQCGPCGFWGETYGCNLGGTTEWYRDPRPDPCDCANTLFHEMSHTCGARDIPPAPAPCGRDNDPLLGACRIGFYFEDGCDEWITRGGGNKP